MDNHFLYAIRDKRTGKLIKKWYDTASIAKTAIKNSPMVRNYVTGDWSRVDSAKLDQYEVVEFDLVEVRAFNP